MQRKKSTFLAVAIAGAVVASIIGISVVSNTQATVGYDTSKLKVTEIAGDKETAKVLKMLNKEDAKKTKTLKEANTDQVDENTVFVISTTELKDNKNDADFKKTIDKILKSKGIVLAAGDDTDILRDVVKNLPADSEEAKRRVDTPVMGYKFIEVPDEENPGQTRFIVDEMHLGPPGGELAEDNSDALALAQWTTTQDLEG